MADVNKRKVKQVNGYKVNHPFSAGNIIYALFILVLIAVPVGLLFAPLVFLPDFATGLANGSYFTGLDIATAGLNAIKQLLGMELSPQNDNLILFSNTIVGSKPEMEQVVGFLFMGQAGLIALMALNSVIGFIFFLINIIKGYLRHSGGVKAITVLDFLYCLFFSLIFVIFYILAVIAGAQTQVFVWLGLVPFGAMLILLIIMSSIRSSIYKNVVFEDDLEYKSDEQKEVLQETNVHTITVTNYEPSNTLPQNISSIGGHAYAEDQNLMYANIPEGIDKLGPGAFANCLKLKVVSIPMSVKEIGYNCFFNCVSLERINYAGSKDQWRRIVRGSNWLAKAKTSEVVCVDGAIVVNPYH